MAKRRTKLIAGIWNWMRGCLRFACWLALPSVVPAATLQITNRAEVQFVSAPGQSNQLTSAPVIVLATLDSSSPGGLFIQKIASRQVAEIGDFIDYTVRVRNVGTNTLPSVIVN